MKKTYQEPKVSIHKAFVQTFMSEASQAGEGEQGSTPDVKEIESFTDEELYRIFLGWD